MSSGVKCKFDGNTVAAAAMAATLLCTASSLAAQSRAGKGPPRYIAGDERAVLDSALQNEDVQAALLYVNEHKEEMTETLRALAQNAAGSSGSMRERAELVAKQMRDIGLKDVSLESGASPNVHGRIKGRSRGAILFVSTLSDAPRSVARQSGKAHGPSTDGDPIPGPGTRASAPTAALLAAAAALREEGVRPARDLIFATLPADDAGLEGMKRLCTSGSDSIVAVIEVQGDGTTIASAPARATTGGREGESSLLAASVAIVKWFGMEPSMKHAPTAHAKVAIAGGTPAIVLGAKREEAGAALDESADLDTMVRSAKHVVLLAATLR